MHFIYLHNAPLVPFEKCNGVGGSEEVHVHTLQPLRYLRLVKRWQHGGADFLCAPYAFGLMRCTTQGAEIVHRISP